MGNLGGFDNFYGGNLVDLKKITSKKITVLLGTKYGTVFKFRVDGARLSRVDDENTTVFCK